MELEKSVETYLRTGSWTGRADDNPVVIERGVTYVRHNAIRIGNALDSDGGLSIQFLWNNMIVGWVRVHGARLDGIRHRTVGVPEGRHAVASR